VDSAYPPFCAHEKEDTAFLGSVSSGGEKMRRTRVAFNLAILSYRCAYPSQYMFRSSILHTERCYQSARLLCQLQLKYFFPDQCAGTQAGNRYLLLLP
jgi:hypothetical protein